MWFPGMLPPEVGVHLWGAEEEGELSLESGAQAVWEGSRNLTVNEE